MNKYNAKREGKYASRREAKRAIDLQILEKAGVIYDLKEQIRFELIPKQDGELPLCYVADFQYFDETGKLITEDCKGYRTEVYRIKRKLMLHVHGIKLLET